jgi:hypothetical protein
MTVCTAHGFIVIVLYPTATGLAPWIEQDVHEGAGGCHHLHSPVSFTRTLPVPLQTLQPLPVHLTHSLILSFMGDLHHGFLREPRISRLLCHGINVLGKIDHEERDAQKDFEGHE